MIIIVSNQTKATRFIHIMALILDPGHIAIAAYPGVLILHAAHIFAEKAHRRGNFITDTYVEDILITPGGVIPIVPAVLFNCYNSSIIGVVVIYKEIASVVITCQAKNIQAATAGQGTVGTGGLSKHAGEIQLIGAIGQLNAFQMGINNHGRNILAPTSGPHGHAAQATLYIGTLKLNFFFAGVIAKNLLVLQHQIIGPAIVNLALAPNTGTPAGYIMLIAFIAATIPTLITGTQLSPKMDIVALLFQIGHTHAQIIQLVGEFCG